MEAIVFRVSEDTPDKKGVLRLVHLDYVLFSERLEALIHTFRRSYSVKVFIGTTRVVKRLQAKAVREHGHLEMDSLLNSIDLCGKTPAVGPEHTL